MDDNQFDNIKDAEWKNAESEQGEIKIRNVKSKKKLSKCLKVLAFVLVAMASGGVSGGIVAGKMSSNTYSYGNNSIFNQSQNNSKTTAEGETSKNSINKVAESVGPAVVGIIDGYGSSQTTTSSFNGSGIIIDSNGYIVTNNHVISGATTITVKLSSGKTLTAKVVGTDSRSDLAVIKVDAENLPIAKFGDSSKVKAGDVAIAIGNPLGDEFSGSVTAGIISAVNRKIQYEGTIYKVIQTDAAINSGNSGGPLCNETGEVIGINSLKIGSSEDAEGMGFAISINEAKSIIKSLMSTGKVSRAYLGIYGVSVVAGTNNIQGVYVKEVVSGSGAEKAGLKPTDIITEIDGTKITKFEELSDILDKHKVGDSIACKVWRSGKTISMNIALSEMTGN
jgi:serine protease Do